MTHVPPQEERFLRLLAEHVRHHVPSWVELWVRNGRIAVGTQGIPEIWVAGRVGRLRGQREGAAGQAEVLTALNLLDSLQDFIARTTQVPWPTKEMPMPSAVVQNNELLMSYGTPGNEALSFEPIGLVDLLLDEADR